MGQTTNKEREGFTLSIQLLLLMAVLLLLSHHYFYTPQLGFQLPTIGKIAPQKILSNMMGSMATRWPLMFHPLLGKVWILFLVVLYSLGSRGKIDPELKPKTVWGYGLAGFLVFMGSTVVLYYSRFPFWYWLYTFLNVMGLLWLYKAGQLATRIMYAKNRNDIFNDENETFPQNQKLMQNAYSINYATNYYFDKAWRKGYVNVINPFRGNMVLGTPGSGKSFAVLIPALWQSIWKGYTVYVYDYKFPTLTLEAYNAYVKTLQTNKYAWGKQADGQPLIPRFYVINFDDIEYSHRGNPLSPAYLEEIIDASEAARTIMMNLNKSWVTKEGDFFVESAINFLASVIWYMRIVSEKYQILAVEESKKPQPNAEWLATCQRLGQVCTFPHMLEFSCLADYQTMFRMMASYHELEVYIRPFQSAATQGANEQLEGQIASVRIPLARLSSPTIYWVMTGDDFGLDINNPQAPKIICTGNNPERAASYAAVFSLFTSKMLKTINKQGRLKSALFWDELPTMFIRGIDHLIATARSNRVATWLGFQDFEQLARDYGDKEARVISNVIGNVFSGAIVHESAEKLSKRFGRTQQEQEQITFSKQDTTVNLSTALHDVIPASKIATLKQGEFVGQISDNFGEEVELKTFKAFIEVDTEGMRKDIEALPAIKNIAKLVAAYYPNEKYEDRPKGEWKKKLLSDHYKTVKADVVKLVEIELAALEAAAN